MSEMELRLIHATPLITEVAEKIQTILPATGLLGVSFIIDVNPVSKYVLDPFYQAHSDGISIPLPMGKKLHKGPISPL